MDKHLPYGETLGDLGRQNNYRTSLTEYGRTKVLMHGETPSAQH